MITLLTYLILALLNYLSVTSLDLKFSEISTNDLFLQVISLLPEKDRLIFLYVTSGTTHVQRRQQSEYFIDSDAAYGVGYLHHDFRNQSMIVKRQRMTCQFCLDFSLPILFACFISLSRIMSLL